MRYFITLIGLFILSIHINAQISSNIDSLLTLVETLKESPEKVRLLRDIGFNYTTKAPNKALEYYKMAVVLGEKINESKYTISSYSQLAILNNNLGDIANADLYLEKTHKKAFETNNSDDLRAYYQAATVIFKKRKKFQQALVFAKQSVELNKKAENNNENLAGAFLNLANCYTELKQYRLATTHYFDALTIFDNIKNIRGQAYCYNNIGITLKDLGQYNDALKNAQKSLELKIKINDKKGIANSYQLIAEIYYMLKQPQKTLSLLDSSYTFLNSQNLNFELVNNYHLKARAFNQMKDSINVVKYYNLAIGEAQKLDALRLVQSLEKEKAEYISSSEDIKKNEVLALKDLATAKKNNDTTLMLENLNFLTTYAYQNKEFKKAYDYREDYLALQKIISGPNVALQLKRIESQYELEKKENAITLLQKNKQIDLAKLKQHRIALYSSIILILMLLFSVKLFFNRNRIQQEIKRNKAFETMRLNIASDLHDDIGSTLSSIQIISNLTINQLKDHPHLTQPINRIAELTNKVSEGIREIVWSINPSNNKLDAVIIQLRKMASDLLSDNEIIFKISESIVNPNIELSPEQRKNILMIYKEAINNARKYSHTKCIDIMLNQVTNTFTISIKDYGVGFDLATTNRGNGLNNIERRARALNAKLEIQSQKTKGTKILLQLPLS